MKRFALIGLAAAWLLLSATPRVQRGEFIGNVRPTCNAATGTMTLPDSPRPSASLMLFVDGIVMTQGPAPGDYTLSAATISPDPFWGGCFGGTPINIIAFYTR